MLISGVPSARKQASDFPAFFRRSFFFGAKIMCTHYRVLIRASGNFLLIYGEIKKGWVGTL
jgi:hypothetical protein